MDVIERKGGVLIKKASNVFEKNIIKCSRNHQFEILTNDINLGKWCDKCIDVVDNILTNLSIKFNKNQKIGNFEYPYVISGERNFLILLDLPNREDMIQNGKKNNYNIIIIDDLESDKLESKIWESIRDNKEFLHVCKKQTHQTKHQCHLTKNLGKEDSEESSIVKYTPGPYPIDMRKVVGYIRVSTVMQVQDGFSLEAQESKIESEANKMNGFLKGIFIDKGISGGSMKDRKALEEMMKKIETGDWIVVNSVSRLARKTKDLLTIVEFIEKKGCHLLIIDLNLDITSPSGKLILTLMGSQAQFEREITSERVKGVMQHLKKTGSLRTKPPFGLKMNPDHSTGASIHIRDEEEQKIISQIRLLRKKYPKVTITRFSELLNIENLAPPRKSKKWYHATLKEIMKREGIN